MIKLLGLVLLVFCVSCGQGKDISGVYVADKWNESILFRVGETGYEVVETDRGYTFTLIGVSGGRIIGKKETKLSVSDDGYYRFQMLPAVDLKLKPDSMGLGGFVIRGDETHSIHFRKIR